MPKIRIGALVQINIGGEYAGQNGIVVSYKYVDHLWSQERWVVLHGETSKDLNWFYENELKVLA